MMYLFGFLKPCTLPTLGYSATFFFLVRISSLGNKLIIVEKIKWFYRRPRITGLGLMQHTALTTFVLYVVICSG